MDQLRCAADRSAVGIVHNIAGAGGAAGELTGSEKVRL
jgi:hypothetical protein